MKNTAKTNILKVFLAFFLFTNIMGCGEMLDNPTVDKDTGENITLLIVDFNFFTTRMDFKFVDDETNTIINKSAKMWFTGEHANDIVNFGGEKNEQYQTSEGRMELTVDPNIDISSTSPLEYAVNVEIDGYRAFAQGIQINSEGNKTFELRLKKETDDDDTTMTGEEDGDSFVFSRAEETKSAKVKAVNYKISYRITKTDILRFKDIYGQFIFDNETEMMKAYKDDKQNFIKLYINKDTNRSIVTDRLLIESEFEMVRFTKVEIGNCTNLAVNSRMVADLNGGKIRQKASYLAEPKPDVFGFANFVIAGWIMEGTTIEHSTLGFSYTLLSASLDGLCATGSSISFSSNAVSTFSIDADFYSENGRLLKATNFKGKFPETFTLENVPSESARVVFRNNNSSFKPIANLSIENLCSGKYEIDVMPAAGFKEYQVTLLATCANNKTVAVAPTYSGQLRIKNSGDAWQGIDMESGKVDILAKPNEEYELRLLWEDQWEGTTFRTEFDAKGNYLHKTSSKISSEKMKDGRTRIKIEHEFDKNICNDMNW